MTHSFVEFLHVHVCFTCLFDGAKLGPNNGSRRDLIITIVGGSSNVVHSVELQTVTRYLNRLHVQQTSFKHASM